MQSARVSVVRDQQLTNSRFARSVSFRPPVTRSDYFSNAMSEELKSETAAPQHAAPIVLAPSDLHAYNSLRDGAALFTLGARHISRFVGAKSAETLNGLVTNDVTQIAVGRGLYAAALQPKGKMLADLAIYRVEPEAFLVETSELAGRDWFAMIRKYVNPRLSQYKDESASFTQLAVYGKHAAAVLAKLGVGAMGDAELTTAMQQGLEAWPDWAHANFALSGMTVRLIRAPHLGDLPGFVLLVDSNSAGDARRQIERAGAVPGSDAVWAMAQLEAGRPVFGLDMDTNTIPQEANLDDWAAISYEKGCYTGQETVARVHFRGHVNRHLRGLTANSGLVPGSAVHDESGKAVGDVRRSGTSPRLGHIAIGMIRREIAAGTPVIVRGADTETPATIRSTLTDN